ncbi:mechanosensitive ion channel family protein [Niabella sp. CC-SYL272]|uniref:mechanosensitive ion channel family protein n=1 Tax=Niabella agricola TaxID=2891571 RepID=UPI001F2E1E17|nr:mechanosensitive ion channel family protein [Niabella agricola]MCF3107614.1 mechanosensitive ion channel family protein [Niabella agricola]
MKAEEWLHRMYAWMIKHGPAVLLALVVLLLGLWLIRLFSAYLSRVMQKRQVDRSLKPFLQSMVILLLRVLLLLAVMQIAGVTMTLFAALVTSFGVAAGLALSGTLQNFASGVLILFLKPFRAGDHIIAQGQEGAVTEIRIFYTIVTTFDNRIVVIPNSKLSNEVIVNVSASGNRRLDIELKFTNGVDYEQVKRVIDQAIDDAGSILHEPPKRIGISSLEPDGYKVMLNLWVSAHGFIDIKLQFQERLLQRLKQSGLPLPGM